MSAICEMVRSPWAGDPGRLGVGDAVPDRVNLVVGWSVKRNNRPGVCQNNLRETNMLAHWSSVSSSAVPTAELKLAIKPMRSSFGIRFLPFSRPSLLMRTRHSPRGLPAAGVNREASVVRADGGAFWWKYQHSVTHSIMATCRVGLAAGLKSWLEGLDMDEMKRLSFWRVGLVKAWM